MTPFPQRRPPPLEERAFMDEGLCRPPTDPAPWFSQSELDQQAAKRVCRSCPVMFECLDYAIRHRERENVWGGHTPEERATIRRRRARLNRSS